MEFNRDHMFLGLLVLGTFMIALAIMGKMGYLLGYVNALGDIEGVVTSQLRATNNVQHSSTKNGGVEGPAVSPAVGGVG